MSCRGVFVLLFDSLVRGEVGEPLNSGLQNVTLETSNITISCAAQHISNRLGVNHQTVGVLIMGGAPMGAGEHDPLLLEAKGDISWE